MQATLYYHQLPVLYPVWCLHCLSPADTACSICHISQHLQQGTTTEGLGYCLTQTSEEEKLPGLVDSVYQLVMQLVEKTKIQ